MLPSEILERSRSSALRIRAIDAEIRELHEKIGVQGHSYGFHGKNDIRDPMCKVDEMLDGTVSLEMERLECRRDVMSAQRIIDGMRELDELSRGRFTTDAEYVLTEYFVFARSIAEVARGSGYPADVTMRVIDANLAFCDSVGCAGLYAARNRGIDAQSR